MRKATYIITDKYGKKRLVMGRSMAEAIRFVAKDQLTGKTACTQEVVELMQSGIKAEDATAAQNDDIEGNVATSTQPQEVFQP